MNWLNTLVKYLGEFSAAAARRRWVQRCGSVEGVPLTPLLLQSEVSRGSPASRISPQPPLLQSSNKQRLHCAWRSSGFPAASLVFGSEHAASSRESTFAALFGGRAACRTMRREVLAKLLLRVVFLLTNEMHAQTGKLTPTEVWFYKCNVIVLMYTVVSFQYCILEPQRQNKGWQLFIHHVAVIQGHMPPCLMVRV